MKLSKLQQLVIDKMNDGWELGSSASYRGSSGSCWLQKGKLGHGGESINVNRATLYSLLKRKLIKHIYGFPTSKYILIKEEK